jgi:hypothetical protein
MNIKLTNPMTNQASSVGPSMSDCADLDTRWEKPALSTKLTMFGTAESGRLTSAGLEEQPLSLSSSAVAQARQRIKAKQNS